MKQFGLIGFPLGHSFSQKFFTEKFGAEAIDAHYELYPLSDISQFPELIQKLELTGLNVTIPYKEQVIQYLDELDDTAAQIGAVNVIKFIRSNGKVILRGYNSDAIGFETSIQSLLQPHHQKALILGTGGASKAVDYTLKKLGLTTQFVSRNSRPGIFSYEQVTEELIGEYTVIVNASPLGMYPNVDACPDIPYAAITEQHLLYDVIYRPEETLFLNKGKKQGAIIENGMEMLYGQARAAWSIWNN